MFIFGTLSNSMNNSNKGDYIVRPGDKDNEFILGASEGDTIEGTDGRA